MLDQIEWWHIVGTVAVAVFIYITVLGPADIKQLVNKVKRSKTRFSAGAVPRDTVILYQFERGPWTPCISPFCLKLETYLRMTDTPYKTILGLNFGERGRLPWIQYNDEAIPDSELCVKFLKKLTGVDLNKDIPVEKLATARGFLKILDESIFKYYTDHLWVRLENRLALDSMGCKRIAQSFVSRKWRQNLDTAGYLEFSEEQRQQILEDDLKSLSDYLGKNEYLFGHNPTDIDCATFELLYNAKVNFPGSPAEKLIKEKFVNINEYLERIKDRYWPDWDECITDGGTKKATK